MKSNKSHFKENLRTGSHHYRAFVGPYEKYDIVGAMQFNLLTSLGLRDFHYLLDIGCGSLRAGRLFISYLCPNRYFGIEPEKWLIEEGIIKEFGKDLIKIKAPTFSNDNNFTCTIFNQKFDFILAHSIFSHASQEQIKRCISQAKETMKSTSLFLATFKKGDNNYCGEEWVYPGCVTYTQEKMKELIEEFGLVCKPIDWYHPNKQTWILITYPENEVQAESLDCIYTLRQELNHYKERLQRLENFHVIRLGRKINRVIRHIRAFIRTKPND